jgi:transposase InsO family protein
LELGTKAFLQPILDNFSRRIVGWKASSEVSALSSSELLRSAFASIASAAPQQIDLIVDGGGENNNRSVEAFLATTPIRKLVARVDVSFSNSMIETVNKIIKYDYLFRSPIQNRAKVASAVAKAIDDYNGRPHYVLKGLSPNDAYSRKVFDEEAYRKRLAGARSERLRINRASCYPCVPLDLGSEGIQPWN